MKYSMDIMRYVHLNIMQIDVEDFIDYLEIIQ